MRYSLLLTVLFGFVNGFIIVNNAWDICYYILLGVMVCKALTVAIFILYPPHRTLYRLHLEKTPVNFTQELAWCAYQFAMLFLYATHLPILFVCVRVTYMFLVLYFKFTRRNI
jgi:hypothetical protein